MKRFATILAAGAVLLSAQSAMADTCYVEEISPTLKTFGFSDTNKNFREIVRNRLIVIASTQAKTISWPRSTPSAVVTCFSDVDSAPTLMQKLEVYRDARSNEFKVRETGL